MSIEAIINSRSISSIVHFTSNKGSLGVLASRALKSRHRLNSDELLKHIFQPNAAYRGKDKDWLDFVNLSISKINTQFFDVASGSWHKEKNFFWCILDFSPEILMHHDVHFTTTNNIYTGVQRGKGAAALEDLFKPVITQWQGRAIQRPTNHPICLPTCYQAEVLYPGELSTNYLQKIHVRCDSDADEIAGQIAAVAHPEVNVEVNPGLFAAIK